MKAIGAVPRYVMAASFLHKDDAHEAAAVLKTHGFKNVWIGLTVAKSGERFYGGQHSPGDVRVRAENKFECFFDSCDETLHNKLIRRGVQECDLHAIAYLPPNGAVLTVETGDYPAEAARIITAAGGKVFPCSQRPGDMDADLAADEGILARHTHPNPAAYVT